MGQPHGSRVYCLVMVLLLPQVWAIRRVTLSEPFCPLKQNLGNYGNTIEADEQAIFEFLLTYS